MLTFTLTGSVNWMHPSTTGDLALAVLSPRRPAEETHSVITICREASLVSLIQRQYGAGDHVRIQGELEPRRREVGGMRVFDVRFIVHSIERICPEEGLP